MGTDRWSRSCALAGALLALACIRPLLAAPPGGGGPQGVGGGQETLFPVALDVGNPCYEGSTSFDPLTESYTLVGGGIDIWTDGDQFHFAFLEAAGDFTLTAHVAVRQYVPGVRWGKIGIMAREDLSSRARYSMVQTHEEEFGDADRFAARPTPGGSDNFETIILQPGQHRDWMRLVREGNVFTGYFSVDGSAWQQTGSLDWGPTAPVSVLLGLAVNSHSPDGCAPATMVFDQILFDGQGAGSIVQRHFEEDAVCPGAIEAVTVRLGGNLAGRPQVHLEETVLGDAEVTEVSEGGIISPSFPGGGGEQLITWDVPAETLAGSGLSYRLRGSGGVQLEGFHDGLRVLGPAALEFPAIQVDGLGHFARANDVGMPCYRGSAAFDPVADTYTLTGGGRDIWTEGDEFHFAYRRWQGDFSMIAHVASRDWAPASRWGKVGIMAREDCSPRARYAMIQTHGEDPGDEDRFAARPTAGGNDNFEQTGLQPGQHRDWLRLDRRGPVVSGFLSSDGLAWTLMGSVNWDAAPPGEVLLGLAVNSHSTDGCEPATIVFDEVLIGSTFETLQERFRRGDVDGNGILEITDAIRLLNFLFVTPTRLSCLDAADADDDELLRLTDAVRILTLLFIDQTRLPPPGADGSCGIDPQPQSDLRLNCGEYPGC